MADPGAGTSDDVIGSLFLQAVQDLARATTIPQAVSAIMHAICTTFRWEGGLLWTLNQQRQVLTIHECWQLDKEASYCSFVAGTQAMFGERNAGKAWAQGKAIYSPRFYRFNETQTEETERKLQEYSSLSVPAICQGRTVGVVEFFGHIKEPDSERLSVAIQTIVNLLGLFLVSFDQEQKLRQLQEALSNSNGQLQLTRDDVAKLTHRLQQAHDHLTESSRFRAQFINDTSHALRTPMNGIAAMAELLVRTELNAQQKEYLEVLGQSVDVLLNIIQDMISFSQKDAGLIEHKEALALEPVMMPLKKPLLLSDLRVLVVRGLIGCCDTIDTYAIASGVQCEKVSCGANALTAIKQAAQAQHPFDLVYTEVVLPDIDAFELARQIKNEPLTNFTRLVLVTTFQDPKQRERAIKAGFAGCIQKPLKQSQFMSAVDAVLGRLPLAETSEAESGSNGNGHRTLLVAEDNPVNQKVALLQLQELGFRAHIVANGKEALDAVKKKAYDAILMDCQMPEMDGFESTRLIREREKETGKRIPIIAMTARAMANDRQQCLEAGMDDYLSKPVTAEKLDEVLNRWIDSETDERKNQSENKVVYQDFSPGAAKMKPATNSSSPPVKVETLEEMLGETEAKEILELFITTTEELLEKIDSACQSHDTSRLKEAAHELKGSCSSIGADELADACKQLEMAARNDEWSTVADLQKTLNENFLTAKTYITQLYARA